MLSENGFSYKNETLFKSKDIFNNGNKIFYYDYANKNHINLPSYKKIAFNYFYKHL